MKTRKYETVVQKRGKGALVPVPFDPNEEWGLKEWHYIAGTVAGLPIRGVIESKDGTWSISLGPACVRGVTTPDTPISVEIAPEGPQVDELAQDIQEAFAAAPEARRFFQSLATFYRTGFIKPIEQAKRSETRTARISNMIVALESGRNQP